MILYPLQIDSSGGFLTSNDPLDLAASEVRALLDTVLWSRPLRMSYGTKTYVLTQLELGQLLVDLGTKLSESLGPFGFSNVTVSSTSSLQDFQSGVVKLLVNFKYGGNSEALYYDTTLDNLRETNANR